MNGVLASWAVPKGIPEDIAAKRLAVHVEDHPLEYGSFEGEIPKGSYGAGKVIIWDAGVWKPLVADWRKSFDKGKLKFHLDGRRLNGDFLLARMGDSQNWLLRRLPDTAADPGEVLPKEKPAFCEPQLARTVTSVPTGRDWGHEIKLDGYRIIAVKYSDRTTLHTRNGHDWTDRFGPLATRLAEITTKDFVIDGEAVVFDEKGRSSFGRLQTALKESPDEITYVAFDLLHFDGRNLRNLPLRSRAERLADLLEDQGGSLRISKIWAASQGMSLFRQACENGLEGIVSKKLNGRYLPGSRAEWVKSKCRARQEFVICGFTPPRGSRVGFGALLLASHENGKLVPRGKVGTGFTDKRISGLLDRFRKLKTAGPLIETTEKDVTWLRPELVAEIEFAEITRDGVIRQGSFVGLREDKSAREVGLESLASPHGTTVLGLKISHPDRIVFPGMGITKMEVARYYEQVASLMMPYVAKRPLAILRAPEGTGGDMFFQKSFTKHVPEGVHTRVFKDGTTTFYITDPKGLVSLAQHGVIEVHPWGQPLTCPTAPIS